jgi:hypothetical protein
VNHLIQRLEPEDWYVSSVGTRVISGNQIFPGAGPVAPVNIAHIERMSATILLATVKMRTDAE